MTPDRPERKNPRLRGWDYGAGGTYFVTFCTSAHRPVLSSVRRGDPCGRPPLVLTPLGECVAEAIALTGVRVEHQVIMPNHVHLLLTLERAATELGRLVGTVKSRSVHLAAGRGLEAGRLWQRGYYDHIVRSENDFLRIWTYIDNNPLRWELDCYYTER